MYFKVTALSALLVLSCLDVNAAENSPAPNCKLAALSTDQAYQLQQFRGKVVYVDFWASWCPPCAKSFPFMNQLHDEFKDKGLQVLGVNLDEVPADAQAFLSKQPVNFAIAADNKAQCAQSFGVQAMPSSYIVDKKGFVRYKHLGFQADQAQQIRALVALLLTEEIK